MTDELKLNHHRSVSVTGYHGLRAYERGGLLYLEYEGSYLGGQQPIPIDQETLKTLLPALMHYAATGRLPEEHTQGNH